MGCGSSSCCRRVLHRCAAVAAEHDCEQGLSPCPTVALGRPIDQASSGEEELLLQAASEAAFQRKLLPHWGTKASPEAILAEGSLLHGYKIAPAGQAEDEAATSRGHGSAVESCEQFEDADGLLELSAAQQRVLEGWQRFPELFRSRGSVLVPAVFAGPPECATIRQGFVTDCSLISAFSVLAEYERRFSEPVLSGMIYPKRDLGGRLEPAFSEYGRYWCRLFFNGTERKVIVDDRVPVGAPGSRLLCAYSTRENELWVTLLEKAMAKIMGGSYDMRGSNPGTDLFHLTGWVPENIPLRNDGSNSSSVDAGSVTVEESCNGRVYHLFSTALQGYHAGHCVVCIGTSELPDARQHSEASRCGYSEGVSASTGLVAGHAYPVLDCRAVNGHELLFLKNPWGRIRWRGCFSPDDSVWSSRPGLAEALGYDLTAAAEDDGRFWIAWSDVLRHFSHLYLCWAPRALGPQRLELHHRWEPAPHLRQAALPDGTDLVAFCPQFRLRLSGPLPAAGGDIGIWVLLSRHIRSQADVRAHFMAVAAYRGDSWQCGSDELVEQGVYSNGECALLKLRKDTLRGGRDFVLVVSQHASLAEFSFTLQVYPAVPGTLAPLPPLVPDGSVSGEVRGQWTPRTAGGCSNSIWSYLRNPQWRLTIPERGLAALVLVLECSADHTLNLRLFQGPAALPQGLKGASSSGAYRRACCVLRLEELAPGPCVVVVSTFHAGLCSDYRLVWYAEHSLELRPQPHPFACALAHPLKCSVRTLRTGQRAWLSVRPTDPRAAPTRTSLRLQADATDGPLPLLELFDAGNTSQPLHSNLLQEPSCKEYFAHSGAVVIVLAELMPGSSYLLEVLVPREYGALVERKEAKLYINSDGPLAVADASASMRGWH